MGAFVISLTVVNLFANHEDNTVFIAIMETGKHGQNVTTLTQDVEVLPQIKPPYLPVVHVLFGA